LRGELALELIHAQTQKLDLRAKLLDLIERWTTQLSDRISQPVARGDRGMSRLLPDLSNAAARARGAPFRSSQDVVRQLLRALPRQRSRTERALDRARDRAPYRVGNTSARFRSGRHAT